MQRLAIVSSYQEPCGVAFYASRLYAHLKRASFDPTVLRLPVTLLHVNRPSYVRRKGDLEIAEIAEKASTFDAVLLQMEPGLYGSRPHTAYRRMTEILRKAKRAVVTVHGFDRVGTAGLISKLRSLLITESHFAAIGWNQFSASTAASAFWRFVAQSPHINVITTCAQDAEMLRLYYDIERVDHYPVTFYSADEVAAIKTGVDRVSFLSAYGLNPARRHIGIFGFLSSYKGHLAALRSLEYLPDDWELSIIGGEHPRAITADDQIGAYLKQLLMFGRFDKSVLSERATFASPYGGRQIVGTELLGKSDFRYFQPKSTISDRVHFLGQPSDDEMPRFYAAFDYAVHPYIRTGSGQSGSGIAALALEFGINAIFSNAPVFREIERYFQGAMPFANVGNFVELAQALERYDEIAPMVGKSREKALGVYNPEGMVAKYVAALGQG